MDILRRAGLKVVMASIMGRRDVKSSREIIIQADCLAENVDFGKAKLIVLPGGRIGTVNLSRSDIVLAQCSAFAKRWCLSVRPAKGVSYIMGGNPIR